MSPRTDPSAPTGHDPRGPLVDALASMERAAAEHHDRAVEEAAVVASWFVDVAGTGGTHEHEAVAAAIGPPMSPGGPAGATLTSPDAVLMRLLGSGRLQGAWSYYRAVMDLAHATVALGVMTTAAALAALDDLRRGLMAPIDAAGARPGGLRVFALAPDTPTDGADDEARHQLPGEGVGVGRAAADDDRRERDLARDEVGTRSVEELLGDLDELIGLVAVKQEVHRVVDRLLVDELRRRAGLRVPEASRHLIFTGNPGTGKTTVARIIGQLYAALGVVRGGHLVETDREGLVAGFVGQTATKVRERFDEAAGGVLLIDEAYSLARGGERDFGREAIDTIVKLAEDRRAHVVVVLAGYPDEMAELVAANPGMPSRFPRTLRFDDYLDDELLQIADHLVLRDGYRLTSGARLALGDTLGAVGRGRGFGNARAVRSLVEQSIDRQASRIAAGARNGSTFDADALSSLRRSDIPAPAEGSGSEAGRGEDPRPEPGSGPDPSSARGEPSVGGT